LIIVIALAALAVVLFNFLFFWSSYPKDSISHREFMEILKRRKKYDKQLEDLSREVQRIKSRFSKEFQMDRTKLNSSD